MKNIQVLNSPVFVNVYCDKSIIKDTLEGTDYTIENPNQSDFLNTMNIDEIVTKDMLEAIKWDPENLNRSDCFNITEDRQILLEDIKDIENDYPTKVDQWIGQRLECAYEKIYSWKWLIN